MMAKCTYDTSRRWVGKAALRLFFLVDAALVHARLGARCVHCGHPPAHSFRGTGGGALPLLALFRCDQMRWATIKPFSTVASLRQSPGGRCTVSHLRVK